jgi:hypothetical protein
MSQETTTRLAEIEHRLRQDVRPDGSEFTVSRELLADLRWLIEQVLTWRERWGEMHDRCNQETDRANILGGKLGTAQEEMQTLQARDREMLGFVRHAQERQAYAEAECDRAKTDLLHQRATNLTLNLDCGKLLRAVQGIAVHIAQTGHCVVCGVKEREAMASGVYTHREGCAFAEWEEMRRSREGS